MANSKLTLAVVFLIVLSMSPVGAMDSRVPDPELDLSSGVDVPTWSIGDFWNYTTDLTFTLIFEIDLSGWINMSVVGIYKEPWGSRDPTYIMNITGEVTGDYTIPFVGSEQIYIDITGYFWTRVQDLSHYRMVTNVTISGTSSLLNDYYGDYPLGYEYYPPLEEYDFPLIPGDAWKVDTRAGAPFSGSPESPARIVQNHSCGEREDIAVPAGTFTTFPVTLDGAAYLWYNETAANSVKRVFDLSIDTIDLSAPLELREYRHGSQKSTIRIWISDLQPVEAGGSFILSGELGASNSMVQLYFPGGIDAGKKILLYPQRTFQFELEAPWLTDNTPANTDHASLGIVAISIGDATGFDVCTLTTRARDLAVYNGSIRVLHDGDGTIDDTFTANFTIHNPFHFRAENFSANLTLLEGGILLHNEDGIYLSGHENISFDVRFGLDKAGEYTLVLEVDPDDRVREFNESNNIISSTFVVLKRPALDIRASPGQGNYTLNEGEWRYFSLEAYRGPDKLPTGNWFLDDTLIGTMEGFNFTTTYIGERSGREHPYRLRYDLPDNATFEGEVSSLRWNITVININRGPILQGASPVGNVRILEGDNVTFGVNVSDPDGDHLDFRWLVDDREQNTSVDSFTLDTSYSGSLSSGSSPYLIEVISSDGENSVNYSWTLHVIDVDRPFTFSLDPLPGNYTVDIDGHLNISFNASDPDGEAVSSRWDLPGGNITDFDHLMISPKELNISGNQTFQVTLVLSSGNIERAFIWNISVAEEQKTLPEEPALGPVGVRITSPTEGDIFLTGENITLSAAHSDEREVSFEWYLDGEFVRGTEPVLDDLDPGKHTVTLIAGVQGADPSTHLVNFTVIRAEAPPPSGRGEHEEDQGIPWWLIVGLVIVVLFLTSLVIFFFSRKRKETWGEEE